MNSIKCTTVLILLAFAPAAFAAISGHCTASGAPPDGICMDRDRCRNTYGGRAYPYCPSDGGQIECCVISDHCLDKDNSTRCTWDDRCTTVFGGRILPGKE